MPTNPYLVLGAVLDDLFEMACELSLGLYRGRYDKVTRLRQLLNLWGRASADARWSSYRIHPNPDKELQETTRLVQHLAFIICKPDRRLFDRIDSKFPQARRLSDRLWELAAYWAGPHGQPPPIRTEWFKDTMRKEREKPGPKPGNVEPDDQVATMWRSKQYRSREELARHLGMSFEDLKLLLDRVRQRKAREKRRQEVL